MSSLKIIGRINVLYIAIKIIIAAIMAEFCLKIGRKYIAKFAEKPWQNDHSQSKK